jgi:hypothetical protein
VASKQDDSTKALSVIGAEPYTNIHSGIVELLEASRPASIRGVNALMTATYWEIGRRIIEFEQKGDRRAEYGEN